MYICIHTYVYIYTHTNNTNINNNDNNTTTITTTTTNNNNNNNSNNDNNTTTTTNNNNNHDNNDSNTNDNNGNNNNNNNDNTQGFRWRGENLSADRWGQHLRIQYAGHVEANTQLPPRSISEISLCFLGRDPGTLKSDIVSKKHPQLICSDLRLSN